MKRSYLIGIVAAVLVLSLGATAFLFASNEVTRSENAHKTVLHQYNVLEQNVKNTDLTVHEDGVVIGTYSLEQLGLLPDALASAKAAYTDVERMDSASFAALPAKEKLEWNQLERPKSRSFSLNLTNLDLSAVMDDLQAQPRQAPQNAYVEFINGSFLVHDEVAGTELNTANVEQQLADAMSTVKITTEAPGVQRVEITDVDCYTHPELTVANHLFDFPAMLDDSLQDVVVTVDFHGKTEELHKEELETLLYTADDGSILLHEEELATLVTGWWETYQEKNVPFLFDSYVDGVIPIEFIKVDYEINKDQLLEQLTEELVKLESADLEPEWYCWRQGEAFSIEGEYIEVDINNQTMTYFKDDEVVVTTPVVTGATWGYPTPEGLYDIDNKDTDLWLSGEDYNVHVDYWMGVVGYMIGIHDADWRTKFGGENYVKNGSHGCINTPKEATKIIFDSVEIGVPVLVHGK